MIGGARILNDCEDAVPTISQTYVKAIGNNNFNNMADTVRIGNVSSLDVLSCATLQSCAQNENHDLVIAVESSSSSNVYFNEVSNEVNDVSLIIITIVSLILSLTLMFFPDYL